MSRLSDLVELIQSANDIYLIEPSRNVRSIFILVDHLCELTMKSWLQLETTKRQQACIQDLEGEGVVTTDAHRSRMKNFFSGTIDQAELETKLGITAGSSRIPILNATLAAHQPWEDWSANSSPTAFKNFDAIITEVKNLRSASPHQNLHDVLDRIDTRRGNRNDFFHDQNKSGLTVDDLSCLGALLDLYLLCELLYGVDYTALVNSRAIVKAQIGLIKLRQLYTNDGILLTPYRRVFFNSKTELIPNGLAHEYCTLHASPNRLINLLKSEYEFMIENNQTEIDKINSMTRVRQSHHHSLSEYNSANELYRRAIDECLT